ncbi:MAG: hypothetical protein ACE5GM_03625 [bacterium]
MIKPVSAADCEKALAEGKRWLNMAREQMKQNDAATVDFLLEAEGKVKNCEYGDSLRQEIYTALGQVYFPENREKAIMYLEKARETGMKTESPNSFPVALLGKIYAEAYLNDITLFPRAILHYKAALEIKNFSSQALARQTLKEYNRLKEKTGQVKSDLLELARKHESGNEWDRALKVYKALLLMVKYDKKLIAARNRAESELQKQRNRE